MDPHVNEPGCLGPVRVNTGESGMCTKTYNEPRKAQVRSTKVPVDYLARHFLLASFRDVLARVLDVLMSPILGWSLSEVTEGSHTRGLGVTLDTGKIKEI